MAKAKRDLELGDLLVSKESRGVGYRVVAGRWVGSGVGTGNGSVSLCPVIIQKRRRGPIGCSSIFMMAVDASAVRMVRDGLTKWLDVYEAGEGGGSFSSDVLRDS